MHLVQSTEVVFDDRLPLIRNVLDHVSHDLLAFGFRKLAPAFFVLSQLLRINLSRTTIGRSLAVLNWAWPLATPVTRLTAGGASITVSPAAFFLLLLLEFFDLFIEAEDDLLLNILGLRTATGQIEPTTRVVH